MTVYNLHEKELEYILKLLELSISSPYESRLPLIQIKEIISNLKLGKARGIKRLTPEHKEKMREGLIKYHQNIKNSSSGSAKG